MSVLDKVVVTIVAVVVGVPLISYGVFVIQMSGGVRSIWLNALPAPDQHRPDVVQQRAAARAGTRSGLVALDRSRVLTPGPETYSARCERGQNNWKVREGYRHSCSVTSGRFYAWDGAFPAMARAVHAELLGAGWKAEFDDLVGLARQYETGRDPYGSPEETAAPTPISFEAFGWGATYERGNSEDLGLSFANRWTKDFDGLDLRQGRRTFDTSWSDTRETVDAKSAVEDLLRHHDGVILATIDQQYFEVSE